MTAARWFSLVVGCLCMTASMSTEDATAWDAVCIFIYRVSAVAMVIVPLVLEFLERRVG